MVLKRLNTNELIGWLSKEIKLVKIEPGVDNTYGLLTNTI